MKRMRTALTVFAAFVLATALAIPAFAQDVPVTGKQGTGSITITNPSPETDYTLYRLFDAKVAANGKDVVYYATNTNLVAGGVDGSKWYTLSANNEVTKTAAMTEAVLQTADFKKWAEAYGTQAGTAKATGGEELVFSKAPEGYYYIKSTLGANVTVNTNTPNVKVIEKNTIVQAPEKKIVDTKNNNTKVQNAPAKLDEAISFSVIEKAANYIGEEKVYNWRVVDSMDPGMTYDPASVVVKVAGVTINPPAYTISWWKDEAATQTATPQEATTFTVDIPWTNNGKLDGEHLYGTTTGGVADIEITYSAKLDSTKKDQAGNLLVNLVDANKNKAGATPSKDKPGTTIPTPPDPVTWSPTTGSFVTNVKVFKFALNDQQQKEALTGAEFTLTGNGQEVVWTTVANYVADNATGDHWKLKSGEYTKTDPNTQGIDTSVYESTTQKYRLEVTKQIQKENAGIKTYVDTNGNLVFAGLGEGTYTLKETKVPAGYNKAADITFTLTFDETLQPGTQTPVGWSIDKQGTAYDKTSSTFTLEVENKAGIALPNTGGLGRTLLLAAGALLAIAGTVSFIVRRRANKASLEV